MNVTRFLNMAPVKVQATIDRMSDEERHALAHHLGNLLQSVAWKFGYVDQRGTLGKTDTHRHGVKRANKLRRTARKGIGYSLPDAAAIHV